MKKPRSLTISKVLNYCLTPKIRVTVVFFAFSSLFVNAQTIENVKATFTGGKVTVSYDLVRADPNQEFELTLYSSHNNFVSSLKTVSGDVGKNIKPGTGKRIEWDALAELGTFKGEITFRVKGEPVYKNISFINPNSGVALRRGKTSTLKWEGGNPNQNIRIDLYKGDQRIAAVGETKNNGQYRWKLPGDLEKGNDYLLKATSGSHPAQSQQFRIRSKVPMFLKIAPLAAVGAVIALWPRDPDKPNNLPAPPEPK